MDTVLKSDDELDVILSNARFVAPRHVAAAMDQLNRSKLVGPCGRPTKSGKPCRRDRSPYVPACFMHVTDEEGATHDSAIDAANKLIDDWRATLVPACWEWPVTDADREAGDLDAWQAGRCAICGGGARGNYTMVTDHDHKTGLIRGVLCVSCNLQEPGGNGRFEKYRQRPPMVMLGIEERYCSPFTGYAMPEVDRWEAAR